MAHSEFSSNVIGVGVVTANLQESLDFYLNVIGMKKVGDFEIDEAFGRSSGLTDGIPFHVDVLKLEESPESNSWKLISFGREMGRPVSGYIHDNIGMQYITIQVTSLEPFLERIKAHGVQLRGETPTPMDAHRHFALVQAPEGTFIELIGPIKH